MASFGGILNQPADTSFAGGYIENWPEEFEKVRDDLLMKILLSICVERNKCTPPSRLMTSLYKSKQNGIFFSN